MWPSGSPDERVKCLVQRRNGILSLDPFNNNLVSVGQSLRAIITEKEETTETSLGKICCSKLSFCFQFNVRWTLEHVGQEDLKRGDLTIMATTRHILIQKLLG